MAADWIATLHEQSEIFRSKSLHVARLLEHEDLSVEVATILRNDVDHLATRFDGVIVDMYAALHDDDPLIESAEVIEQLWSQLCLATANKVRELQGLPLIDPFQDGDDGS